MAYIGGVSDIGALFNLSIDALSDDAKQRIREAIAKDDAERAHIEDLYFLYSCGIRQEGE